MTPQYVHPPRVICQRCGSEEVWRCWRWRVSRPSGQTAPPGLLKAVSPHQHDGVRRPTACAAATDRTARSPLSHRKRVSASAHAVQRAVHQHAGSSVWSGPRLQPTEPLGLVSSGWLDFSVEQFMTVAEVANTLKLNQQTVRN